MHSLSSASSICMPTNQINTTLSVTALMVHVQSTVSLYAVSTPRSGICITPTELAGNGPPHHSLLTIWEKYIGALSLTTVGAMNVRAPSYIGHRIWKTGPNPLLSPPLTLLEDNQVPNRCCVDSVSFPVLRPSAPQPSDLTIQLM